VQEWSNRSTLDQRIGAFEKRHEMEETHRTASHYWSGMMRTAPSDAFPIDAIQLEECKADK
jgi:hypothetical protein